MRPNKRQTIEQKVKLAEGLARKNYDLLPINLWLIKNGYSRLIPTIKQYPEQFKHIKQEHVIKPIEEHVKLAEKLAKENNGVLHPINWLNKNGYAGLVSAIRRHPDNFKHIKQNHKIMMLSDDIVKLAHKLAKENNNILPSHKWLKENGYVNLSCYISKFPKKFKNIYQENLTTGKIKKY